MSELGVQNFLDLLKRSGLLDEDHLKAELSVIGEQLKESKSPVETLSQHLIRKEMITDWHLQKLKAGKYKGFFLGKYKLLRHLGSGGMSSVYLAVHRVSGKLRAVKVLPRKRVADKSYLDRFYLEARAAASLNHPNVVRIYDVCNDGETHYMVMEYVQGKDLYDYVKASGPLPFKLAADYCAQAAVGLSHAHERSLVHRDIKPANLLITDEGIIKILDLGLALVNQEDNESLTLMYNEKVMGTADYLSPEQAVNSHYVDHRADIYSLGCTLYFLLTGHPPFPSGTLAQRITAHRESEPAAISGSRADCPANLAAICRQMMQKKPEHRYQTCADLRQDLLAWIETGKRLGTGLLPGTMVDEEDDSESVGDVSSASSISIDTRSSSKSSDSVRPSAKNYKSNQRNVARQSSKKNDASINPIGSNKDIIISPKTVKWILPLVIVLMFIALLAVLYFVSKTLLPDEPAILWNTQQLFDAAMANTCLKHLF